MVKHIFWILLSYWMMSEAPTTMDVRFMFICALIAIFSLWGFFVYDRNKALKKQNMRHSVLFLASFFIVFYQSDIDFIIGFIDEYRTLLWYDYKVVCKCMCISNIGLNSFCLGYKILSRTESLRNTVELKEYRFDFKTEFCILGYIVLLIYLVTVDKDYLHGGYGEVKQEGFSTIIMVMFQAVLFAVFCIYSYTYRYKKKPSNLGAFYKELRLPLLLALLYMLVILVTGRRTEAIRIAFLLVISYIYCTGKILSLKKILIVAFSISVLMSLVGVMRNPDFTTIKDSNLIQDISISPVTSELSGSVSTLHCAVSNIPSSINYNYGLTFFPKLTVLLPYGQNIFFAVTGMDNDQISSDVLLTSLQPEYVNWGVGSSILADIYVSFGVYGIIVIMLLFGMYVRYLEKMTFCSGHSPYLLILSFCAYASFVYACRASVNLVFLSVSYSAIFVYILSKVHKKKRIRKQSVINKV